MSSDVLRIRFDCLPHYGLMTRLVAFVITLGLVLPSTACLVQSGPRHRSHSSASKNNGCHPSQYWDGNQCRHKGKGKGARKHDGR